MAERRIVAPKVEGSIPSFYPKMSTFFFASNAFIFNSKIALHLFFNKIEKINNILFKFFITNEILWQEGFYTDFLQKKIADNWIKKFLINASYLFNEKLIFDLIIKFFINCILIPFHKFSIFEFNSLANLLFITISILMFFYFIYMYVYVLILFF